MELTKGGINGVEEPCSRGGVDDDTSTKPFKESEQDLVEEPPGLVVVGHNTKEVSSQLVELINTDERSLHTGRGEVR
ncbi:hypothetical protein QYF36_020355 [Acer negundo]|nr:hypothetical protein QYF36_020355 [Acer negundo]